MCKSRLYSLVKSTDLQSTNFRWVISLFISNGDGISRKSNNFYQVRQAHVKKCDFEVVQKVSWQLPPEENCPPPPPPPVRVVVWIKVRVSFRVRGGGSCLASEENYPLVRVRFGLGFVLGLGGGQFSSGTIVLEPFLLALLNIMKRL